MIYKLGLLIDFYKRLFLWSMGANILLTILCPSLAYIFIIKFFLTVLTYHIFRVTRNEEGNDVVKPFGFTTISLYSWTYLLDVAITGVFMLLVSEFI